MTDEPTKFDPFTLMMDALEEAERRRVGITHWQVNQAALNSIAKREEFLMMGMPPSSEHWAILNRPIEGREYFAIPFKIMPEWAAHKEPRLEPLYERDGDGILIVGEGAPLLHGNEYARPLAEARRGVR